MKKTLSLFIVVAILIVAGELYAEDVSLEKIVVTPYKTEIGQDCGATNVEILNVEDEYKKGNYSLVSSLGGDASIIAVKTGGLGGPTSIFLRGNASYHTRFILDGVKIYDPLLTQAYYNPTHLYLNGIEKLEISKGTQSALYGSDAIGGVISLFTKKAKEPFSFSYLQEVGSHGTFTEQIDLESKKGDLGYTFSLIRLDSGGFSSTKESEGNHERDPYHNTNTSLRADYDFDENLSVGAIGRFIYAKYEFDDFDPVTWEPADDNDRHAYNYEGMGTLFFDHQLSDILKQKLQLAFTRIYRKTLDDTDVSDESWYDSKTYQTEWKAEIAPFEFYKLLLGVDYVREKGDYYTPDGDFPKQTLNNKSFYLENICNLPNNTFLSFAYRRDDHSSFGGEDSKTVNISHLIEKTDTKLKCVYAEGFKAPSMYQLYAPVHNVYGVISNSQLASEHSKTYEMGAEQKLSDNLKLEVTYFRTLFKNLINFVSGTGYVNMSKARIYGLETALDYKINDNWDLNLGYTWLDTENKENQAQLERRPENKLNLNAKGNFDKWETNLNLSYVGHRTQGTAGNTLLKPYIILNTSFFYHINKNLDMFLRGENILDEDYELVNHYQTKKFSLYGGFKSTF